MNSVTNERLSKERLAEIVEEYTHAIYPAEVGQMARELLSLRTGEVDEEVEMMRLEISHWIDNEVKCPMEQHSCDDARQELQKLCDRYIARGQQLRAEKSKVAAVEVAIRNLRETVDSATIQFEEREARLKEQLREAQAEVERLKGELKSESYLRGNQLAAISTTLLSNTPVSLLNVRLPENHALQTAALQDAVNAIEREIALRTERDSLQSQLTAMQAASVEEVDALYPHAVCNEDQSRTRKACDLARNLKVLAEVAKQRVIPDDHIECEREAIQLADSIKLEET